MRVWIFVTGLACVACGGPSNERLLTEEDFGDDWPFTVAAGTVRCVQNAVTFDADGVTYAVNGRASASGQAVPIEPIWKTATLPMTSPPVQRLDEPSRRRIFRHIVACEDAAAKQAQAEFPETDAGHQQTSVWIGLRSSSRRKPHARMNLLNPARLSFGMKRASATMRCQGSASKV